MNVRPDSDFEVVETDSQVRDLVDRLAPHPHVCFDTEFVSEHTYRSQLCLVQVAAPGILAVIDTLKEKGLRDDFLVLVGGAPLNEEFGKAVGADAYCRDAGMAVETAKTLIAARRAAAHA